MITKTEELTPQQMVDAAVAQELDSDFFGMDTVHCKLAARRRKESAPPSGCQVWR